MDFADNSFYFCLTFLHSKNRITLWRELAVASLVYLTGAKSESLTG